MPEMLLGPYRALLFDMDGTLLTSRASIERVWTVWSARWDLDPVEVSGFLHGRRATDALDRFLPHLSADQRAAEIDWVETREMIDTTGVLEVPGAAAFLTSLPARQWAIVTSAARRLALCRIRAAGLPMPDVLVTAEDVTVGKPDPSGYIRAARLLGTPVTECAIFEDAPAGIQAALAAGGGVVVVGDDPESRTLPAVARIPDFLGVSRGDQSTASAVVVRCPVTAG